MHQRARWLCRCIGFGSVIMPLVTARKMSQHVSKVKSRIHTIGMMYGKTRNYYPQALFTADILVNT